MLARLVLLHLPSRGSVMNSNKTQLYVLLVQTSIALIQQQKRKSVPTCPPKVTVLKALAAKQCLTIAALAYLTIYFTRKDLASDVLCLYKFMLFALKKKRNETFPCLKKNTFLSFFDIKQDKIDCLYV